MRLAVAEDMPFLWEMLRQAIHVESEAERPSMEWLVASPLAHYLAEWGRPGDRALIAEVDGRPAGAAWYRLFQGDDRGYGYVADDIPELSLAVVPEARGRGVGTSLLQGLLAQSQADGRRGLSLSVDPRNAAVHLYERLGFQQVGVDDGGSWTMLLLFGRQS